MARKLDSSVRRPLDLPSRSKEAVAAEPGAERLSARTRQRLLDAAERLFAEFGLEKVSTRDITQAAHANVGAINYHFGGKDALIESVFERRMAPMNRQRFADLERLEQRGAERPPTVEEVLLILIRPTVEQALDEKSGGIYFSKLIGRSLGETGKTMDRLKETHFTPCMLRFNAVLMRAIPGAAPDELFWRMVFMFGALHYMLLAMNQPLPMECHQPLCVEAQLRRLITFAAAGLRAPYSSDV